MGRCIVLCTYSMLSAGICGPVQDPNWYKARREDGLEGMVPANFLMEPLLVPRAKVNLHKME